MFEELKQSLKNDYVPGGEWNCAEILTVLAIIYIIFLSDDTKITDERRILYDSKVDKEAAFHE